MARLRGVTIAPIHGAAVDEWYGAGWWTGERTMCREANGEMEIQRWRGWLVVLVVLLCRARGRRRLKQVVVATKHASCRGAQLLY